MAKQVNEVKKRDELKKWLQPDDDVPLLVRGESEEVTALLATAKRVANAAPDREVVWVRDPALFTSAEKQSLFKNDAQCLGVALSPVRNPQGWVMSGHIDPSDVDDAYVAAELVGGK